MSQEQTRTIEINGVKMDVDLRTAKTVETYKVGDSVKVLVKKYGSDYSSHPGVIVGIDNFVALPTLIILYLTDDYSGSLKFAYLNANTKDVEICPQDLDFLFAEKESVVERLDREIAKAELALQDAHQKKEYFLKHFASHFEAGQDQ